MTTNEYFDKAFCINLDRRPERYEEAKSEFEKHGLVVERISGVDGNPDNLQTKILPGHVGCVLSHVKILKKAKEENLNNVLVFEDDVVFCDDLQEKFNIFVKQLPEDWDMIYFGGNHNNIPLEMVSENIGHAKKTYTTHAYAIKDTIYDFAIKVLSKVQYEVDVNYSLLQQSFNCYVFRPHLAWQRDGYSDILNKNVDYSFLKK
jgi:GR25 family glycosyltransferase involved in LPS biosynthesis